MNRFCSIFSELLQLFPRTEFKGKWQPHNTCFCVQPLKTVVLNHMNFESECWG